MSLARNLANLKPTSSGLIGSEDVDTSLGQLLGWSSRVINGEMKITQRGSVNVTSGGGNTFTAADRFSHFNYFGSGQINTEISTDAPPGFSYSLLSTVATAVPLSGSTGFYCQLSQGIEGFNIADLYTGNVVVSFWVKSSVTGIYSVALYNTHQLGVASGTRIYVAEYTINAANTWEQKFIVVNLGTGVSAGTWARNNNCGLSINWNLGAESNRKGNTYLNTWGTYTTAPHFQSANQVQWASNSGATFRITGVELRPGSVITLPFERMPYSQEFNLCERYFRVNREVTGGSNSGGTLAAFRIDFTGMRTQPTITVRNSSQVMEGMYYGRYNINAITGTWVPTANDIGIELSATVTLPSFVPIHMFSNTLNLSAEF